jgi:hypothetical protein
VTTDDPVPHRQLAVLDLEPLVAEAAAGGKEFLAEGVEPVDLAPAGGQHDDLLGWVVVGLLPGGPPVLAPPAFAGASERTRGALLSSEN